MDYPAALLGEAFTVLSRAALWLQPERQRFDADAADAGGLISLTLHRRGRRRIGAFGTVEAKTAGWVAGNEYLGLTSA